MKLILYVLKLFFPLFLGAIVIFSFVLELVDLMMNIWKYIYNDVPFSEVLRLMYYFLPKSLSWALPLSVLFASCYMLSMLYSRNELTAVFASGISLIRFTMPLIVVAAFFSLFLFIFQDKVVVNSNYMYETLKQKALGEEKNLNNDHIVIISDMGFKIYKADYYDASMKRLHSVYIVNRKEDKSLDYIIRAEYCSWNEEKEYWMTGNSILYRMTDEKLISSSVPDDIEKTLKEKPETFQNNTISVENETISESREYIRHLKRTGLPYAESLSQYYNKFSFPFIVLILAVLSIGISGKSQRNVFVISLTLSVGAAVLFYVTQMVTMLMAKFGYISPLSGAWFPVGFFMAMSIILLKYSRT